MLISRRLWRICAGAVFLAFILVVIFLTTDIFGGIPYYSAYFSVSQPASPAFTRRAGVVPNPQIPVFGRDSVIFEEGTEYLDIQDVLETQIPGRFDITGLYNLDVLRTRMYTVNPCTRMSYADFDTARFIAADLTINREAAALGKPVVLIFHTHSTEMFIDSNPADKFTGVVGVGAYLAQILNEKGIPTIHMTNRWDIVNGQPMIRGAYERQEADIRAMLARYPSIEVIIDLHRDGLPEGSPRLLTTIDGKPAAQIMFFNGLSQLNVNGVLVPIVSLPNPNLPYNLAFSFQMQLASNELFPGFARRIFLRAYRYSLHFLPKSLLIEVGAQNNTKQEALNAMRPLAQILTTVINP
ncbi:MAG: stage II sporulation protein P [Defluviitaleaceae bacterium]|nr:stage II sporulation protein P [Defluviitaleaceae bacterium]